MTESTTTALLDAAEVAFAAEGIERVSLRSIMRAAGANPAAVHYHYGSREALAQAVLDRLLEPLQARRLELLERAGADTGTPSVAALVEALVRPDVELALARGRRNPGAAAIVGAIYTTPASFVREHVEQSFAPVAERFLPHLAAAAPHVPPDELAWRVRWVVFGVLGAVLTDGVEDLTLSSAAATVDRLVAALAAALAAPTAPDHHTTTHEGTGR